MLNFRVNKIFDHYQQLSTNMASQLENELACIAFIKASMNKTVW